MNIRYITLITFAIIGLFSCKKDPIPVKEEPKVEIPDFEDSPTISYKVINRKLHASHTSPMNLDVNQDGIIDLSYFMQYVVLSGNVNLYIGVNPVFGGATSASEGDDTEFLNMGTIHSFVAKSPIKGDLSWTDDHALLGIRREAPDATRTYMGNWGNGQEKIMALRFQAQGKIHYGWARLKFDKTTEELILIDAAWNTTPDKEIEAGAK